MVFHWISRLQMWCSNKKPRTVHVVENPVVVAIGNDEDMYYERKRMQVSPNCLADWQKIVRSICLAGLNPSEFNEDMWIETLKVLEVNPYLPEGWTYMPTDGLKQQFYMRMLVHREKLGPGCKLEPLIEEFDEFIAMLIYHSLETLDFWAVMDCVKSLMADKILSPQKHSIDEWVLLFEKFIKKLDPTRIVWVDPKVFPLVVEKLDLE